MKITWCKVRWWARMDQPKSNIFSCMILAECSLVLSWSNTRFLLLMSARHFLRRFSCTSLHWVWLQFKNSEWIILRWSHLTQRITFLPLSSAIKVDCRDSSLSISCFLNIVIKDPFFITWNGISKKQVISPLWKKICYYGFAIFLIFLTKSMKNQNDQLANFSYLFQVEMNCGLGCVKVKR